MAATGEIAVAPLARVVASAGQSGFSGVVMLGSRTHVLFEKSVGLADREKRVADHLPAAQFPPPSGEIGGVQVRNIIAPTLSRAVVVFTNRADWEFGEIWQGKGFSYDLLSAALCGGERTTP